MASIFNTVTFNDCQRPIFTSYELSKKVKEKRKLENLSIDEFSKKYDVDSDLLIQVEEAKRSFSPKLYKLCSKVLNLSIDELTAVEKDDLCDASYRASADNNGVLNTVELANKLFNEIIMQKKISVN